MLRILWKLSWSGAHQRLLPGLLMALLALVVSSVLALAFQFGGSADGPWEQLFEATNGPDLEVLGSPAQLLQAQSAPGVIESAGPFPQAVAIAAVGGQTMRIRIEGRPLQSSLDQPLVTDGAWLAGGGVVLERSFAKSMGITPGETIVFQSRMATVQLRVVGLALTVTQARYPHAVPGLGWATPETLGILDASVTPGSGRLVLRLADRDQTAQVADSLSLQLGPRASVTSWSHMRDDALDEVRVSRIVLRSFSILLMLATCCIVPLVVSSRAAARARDFTRLRAIGFTRPTLTLVLAFETAIFAFPGAIAGALGGVLIAPRLVHYQVDLVGRPVSGVDLFAVTMSALVTVVAVSLAAVSSSWRAARHPSVERAGYDLEAGGRARLLPMLSLTRLPVAVLLGALPVARSPRRSALTVACLAVGFAALVAALAMEATFDAQSSDMTITQPTPARTTPSLTAGLPQTPPADTTTDDYRPLVYGLTGAVILLGVVTLAMTCFLGVIDRSREFGLFRAVGGTAHDIVVQVLSGSGLIALLAIAAGIPTGVALFRIAYAAGGGRASDVALPAWPAVALGAFAFILTSAAAAAVPARGAVTLTVVQALRAD